MTGLSSNSLIFGGVIGYLIGSIPSAYLITKRHAGLDLREHGSRNIGTMNAYEVTGKKSIGSLVLVADILKGLLPVLLFEIAGYSTALLVLMPALVLGHCYPIWLKFHGGRGLATMAGASLLVNPAVVIFWLLFYLLAKRIYDDVHFGAIVATGLIGLVLLLLPPQIIELATIPWSGLAESGDDLRRSILIVALIILSRHIGPFLSLIRKRPTV